MTGFDHVPSLDAPLLEPEPAPVQSRYLAGRVSGTAAHKNAAAIKAAVAQTQKPCPMAERLKDKATHCGAHRSGNSDDGTNRSAHQIEAPGSGGEISGGQDRAPWS
jgi:hypothetical protein